MESNHEQINKVKTSTTEFTRDMAPPPPTQDSKTAQEDATARRESLHATWQTPTDPTSILGDRKETQEECNRTKPCLVEMGKLMANRAQTVRILNCRGCHFIAGTGYQGGEKILVNVSMPE